MDTLPSRSLPRVARYAAGGWIDADHITPTHFRWRNACTYLADHDGVTYRVLRITVDNGFVGWWAIEILGQFLPLFSEHESETPTILREGLRVTLSDGRAIILPPGTVEIIP